MTQASPAPDNTRCPRCGEPFRCGAADAAPCPCGGLALPPALLARLRLDYTGCLCLPCLRALQEQGSRAPQD